MARISSTRGAVRASRTCSTAGPATTADAACTGADAIGAIVRADAGRCDASARVSVERPGVCLRKAVSATARGTGTARAETDSAGAAVRCAGQGQGRTALGLHAAPFARARAHPRSSRPVRHARSRTRRARQSTTSRGLSPGSWRPSPSASPSLRSSLGRSYLPGRAAVSGEPGAQVDTPTTTAPTSTPPPAATEDGPIPAGRGRFVVTTQPAGIKVLLDRKARRRDAAANRRAGRPPDADLPDFGRRGHPEHTRHCGQDRDARHPGVLGLDCRLRADRPLMSRSTARTSGRLSRAA